LQNSSQKVWVFIGDMAANTGIAFSSLRLAKSQNLPLRIVVEDNGLSVCTPTEGIWPDGLVDLESIGGDMVKSFKYSSAYPHAGAGRRIEF